MSATPVRFRDLALPCELASVPAARRFVRETLHQWGLDRLADDAGLGVTELAANAVRHAGTDLVLTVLAADRLLVSVSDRRPDFPAFHSVRPSESQQSGRGLQIIDSVAQQWGSFGVGGGKSVWFSLELPQQGHANAEHFEFAAGRRRRDDRRAESAAASQWERQDTVGQVS